MSKVLDTNWGHADPNLAFYLSSMSGSAVKVEGPPGVGKSQSTIQFAKAQGYDLQLIIASGHAPEDFSGIPFPAEDKSHFVSVPASFVARGTKPKCMWFLDEITTPRPDVRAPLMSLISERRVGNMHLAPDLVILAACNPPHMCPNGSPLEPAMANRFGHFTWKSDTSAWEKGMLSDADEFTQSWMPKVPEDWRRCCATWGHTIVSYCKKNPTDRVKVPDEADDELAYPTPRSWLYLRNALAVADSVMAPATVKREIVEAYVGTKAGKPFWQYVQTLDLVDPDDAIANPESFKFDKRRTDLAIALMTSVVTSISANYSEARMEGALRLFLENIGEHSKELALSQLRNLVNAKPEGEAMSSVSMKVLQSFGNKVRVITSK